MYEIKTLNMMQNYKAILTRFVNSKSANFIKPFTCIKKKKFLLQGSATDTLS